MRQVVSNCCGGSDSRFESYYLFQEICPDCKEHCEYIELTDNL